MFLTQIFSVVSLVLGIYIIITYFKDHDMSQMAPVKSHYHLGCFLVDHNLTHSHDLVQKVSELNHKSSPHTAITDKYLTNELFNKQGVQVATRFEDFIYECLTYKQKMRSHVSLAKATNKAYQEYIQCSNQISSKSQFSKTDCTANWNEYEKCTIELEHLKSTFSAKLNEKDKLRIRMGDLFSQKQGGKDKTSAKASELQKQYRIRDRQLQNMERDMETKVKLIMQKVTNFHYNLAVLQNNTLHATRLYNECHDHIKEYRSCQELSEEIRSLGHGSMESFEQKVSRKRMALTKIQQMLSESNGGETSKQLQVHYNRGLQEYKKLHKLFAEMKARMEKHCGCSEAEQKKLKISLQNAINQQNEAKREEESINATFNEAYNKLAQIRGEREKLLADLSNAMEKISSEKDTTINIIELITDLEDEDKKIQADLLTYQRQFDELQLKCNKVRDELSLKLPAIDSYTSCNNKKNYFQSLKNKLDQSGTKEGMMDQRTKIRLRESLKAYKI